MSPEGGLGEPLLQAAGIAMYVVDYGQAPELVRGLAEARHRAHVADRGRDDWTWDAYDSVYQHLVVMDGADGRLLAGLRFARPEEVGWDALRSAESWQVLRAGREYWRRAAEVGRVWIAPEEQRTVRVGAWLWAGLAAVLDRFGIEELFGQVEFAGYSAAGQAAIIDFLRKLPCAELAAPRLPFPTEPVGNPVESMVMEDVVGNLRALQRELARTDPAAYASPWMQWLRLGAGLAGPPGVGSPPNQIVALVTIGAERVRRFGTGHA